MRADKYLVDSGAVSGRDRAARLIDEKKVRIGGRLIERKSEQTSGGEIEIEGDCPFVGRGGLKLAFALDRFRIDAKGKRALDVGASTGGFTDCLLQNGAAFVYAVDSGKDQLHPSLLNDPRVRSLEKTNARFLTSEQIPEKVDLCVMDVSFISQTLLYPTVARFLKKDGIFLSLVKPQFEAGAGKVGKGGIVRDAKVREEVLSRVFSLAAAYGFSLRGSVTSPVRGGDGNVEYLACFTFSGVEPERETEKGGGKE